MIYYIFVNCSLVDTRWRQYSTHLHTNNTKNNTIDTNNSQNNTIDTNDTQNNTIDTNDTQNNTMTQTIHTTTHFTN